MVSVLFGLFAIGLGLIGMFSWPGDLVHFMKGMIPISLFLAGVIAVIAGLSSQGKRSSREKGT